MATSSCSLLLLVLLADHPCRSQLPSTRASSAHAAHCPAALPAHPLQIAKLLIIPFVCFIESSFLGRTFTRKVLSSIVLVVAGVAVVTGAL